MRRIWVWKSILEEEMQSEHDRYRYGGKKVAVSKVCAKCARTEATGIL